MIAWNKEARPSESTNWNRQTMTLSSSARTANEDYTFGFFFFPLLNEDRQALRHGNVEQKGKNVSRKEENAEGVGGGGQEDPVREKGSNLQGHESRWSSNSRTFVSSTGVRGTKAAPSITEHAREQLRQMHR